MGQYQAQKQLIRQYFDDLEQCDTQDIPKVLDRYMDKDYHFKASYPFKEHFGTQKVSKVFWEPLRESFTNLSRRQDIFIAGNNNLDENQVWVMSMGNFMGNFDEPFLNITPTKKIVNIRYAEFSCVQNGKITKTGLFIDLIGIMQQAGFNPLPISTGHFFNYPGPKNHDGLLFEDGDPKESQKTLALVNEMISDLSIANQVNYDNFPPEILEKTWAKDMIWYGPCGIGASYTIPRYQIQHQAPFRGGLGDKEFLGHECRFGEGNFACFFGWPNLSNRPIGGFLGLVAGEKPANMQVVDVYYREGDKLKENWVIIDLPDWLAQQGFDILDRTCSILNPNYIKPKQTPPKDYN